jgi:hypothetical protein
MRIEYKGFALVANREKTKNGIYRTFYSAQNIETRMILSETNDNISIQDAMEELKTDVDTYLSETNGA